MINEATDDSGLDDVSRAAVLAVFEDTKKKLNDAIAEPPAPAVPAPAYPTLDEWKADIDKCFSLVVFRIVGHLVGHIFETQQIVLAEVPYALGNGKPFQDTAGNIAVNNLLW